MFMTYSTRDVQDPGLSNIHRFSLADMALYLRGGVALVIADTRTAVTDTYSIASTLDDSSEQQMDCRW